VRREKTGSGICFLLYDAYNIAQERPDKKMSLQNAYINNNFGIGANLSGGVELTNNINIEIDLKAITGDLMFKNVPVYSTLAEAQSPASNTPISYSNEECNYDIYSISIRFIYIFRFTANK
jgi:hypothetical protein